MAFRTTRVLLDYSETQLFDLVADVERFPEFVPWVVAARIIRRKGTTIWTDMTMGTGILCKRFTTVALLDRPNRIDITCCDPMFERFEQRWLFEPAANGGTNAEYAVDFRFRSGVLQRLIGASFGERTVATVAAFKRRAQKLYGAPAVSRKAAAE